MKKTAIIFLFCMLAASGMKAQISVSYLAGYGKYSMDDAKDKLMNLKNIISMHIPNIPLEVVDNFPGYLTHSLEASYGIKNHEIGIRGTYMTTGGNIAYSDYSGEYSGKLTLNGYRLGLNYRYYIPLSDIGNGGRLSLFAELSPAITFSNFKFAQSLRLRDKVQDNGTMKMDGNGFSLLPQVGVKWNVTPRIGVLLSGGYDLQLGSHLKYENVKSDDRADWSGMRLNAGIAYSFGK